MGFNVCPLGTEAAFRLGDDGQIIFTPRNFFCEKNHEAHYGIIKNEKLSLGLFLYQKSLL
jgi:hypothetical protein